MTTGPDDTLYPRSIAIAGGWGYIGRKFLDVALARGLRTFVFDPGPAPPDVDLSRLTRVVDEAEFYHLDADLFHLATHPEHRRLGILLARPRPPLVLNEKPMAEPEHPETCLMTVANVGRSDAVVLYDFPELFDPLTARVVDHLRGFREVSLTRFYAQRSKDREDPANPRNRKRMVPIQYQESVHCLAFVLYILGALKGGVGPALSGGIGVEADARPYNPPNPEDYPYVVDGCCRYRLSIGGVHVDGLTDFTRGAEWVKRRVIAGVGDGQPFEIDVSYLEGAKSLQIDGVAQPCDPNASSYDSALSTAWRWHQTHGRAALMDGHFPNPRFTRVTYQLSSALWRSCRSGPLAFASLDALNSFDAGFAAEAPTFPRYGEVRS